jgi:lysozyme family protein
MNVDQQIDALIEREGGYSNHPADRGGPTNWGVTEQVARAHGYAGPMQSMPRAEAVRIYKAMYWLAPGFDDVAVLMPKLAEELFDTGVNMGPKRAATFFQRALNALNRGAVDYPDIAADGDIGPMTIHSLGGLIAKRGPQAETVMLRAVNALQAVRYIEIAEQNPSQEAFEWGWLLNRVGAL